METTISLYELRKKTGKNFYLYACGGSHVPVRVRKGELIKAVQTWVNPFLAKGCHATLNIIETDAGFFITKVH